MSFDGSGPADADVPSTATASFDAGDLVTLSGLTSRPELNAAAGTVLFFHDESGRYAVKVAAGGSVRLKPANLQLVEKEAADLEADEAVSGLTSQLSALALDTVRGNVLSDVDLVENILELCMPDSRKTWGRHLFLSSFSELMDTPLKLYSGEDGPIVFQQDRTLRNSTRRPDLRGKACTFLDDAGVQLKGGGLHVDDGFPLISIRVTHTAEVAIVRVRHVQVDARPEQPLTAAVQEVKDALPTLLASRGVCRLWRTAVCRPLLAAVLTRDVIILVSMYFGMYKTKRSLVGSHRTTPGLSSLSPAGDKAFQWLATGFENGTNSLLTVDHGIDHIRIAVVLMQFFGNMHLTGKALVIAPEAARTAWAQALAAANVECFQATTESEMDEMLDVEAEGRIFQGLGVVLLSHESDLSLIAQETTWTHAIFDVVGQPASVALDRIKFASTLELKEAHGTQTAMVTFTNEPLPTNFEDLWLFLEASGIDAHFSQAQHVWQLKARAADAISKYGRLGDDAIERWAVQSFLVPKLHSAMDTAFHMQHSEGV